MYIFIYIYMYIRVFVCVYLICIYHTCMSVCTQCKWSNMKCDISHVVAIIIAAIMSKEIVIITRLIKHY